MTREDAGPWESASADFEKGVAMWPDGDLDVGKLTVHTPELTIVNSFGQPAKDIITDPDGEYLDGFYSAPGEWSSTRSIVIDGKHFPLTVHDEIPRPVTWYLQVSFYQLRPLCNLAAQFFVQIWDGQNWSEYHLSNIFSFQNRPANMPFQPLVFPHGVVLPGKLVASVFRCSKPQARFALSYGCQEEHYLSPLQPGEGWIKIPF